MRPSTACVHCRTGKRKCDRTGNSPCSPCLQRQLQCPGTTNTTRISDPPMIPKSSSSNPSFDTRTEEIYLVDLYFRFIHNSPHSLFHEATFKDGVTRGIVAKPVLLAMMGMSARFANQPDIVARGAMYRAKASAALKEGLENICIENIQACILVGNNYFGEGDADAESLYFGLASRMSQILKLGVSNDTDDGITREVKRRIFWTCFIIDTWASGGSNLSRQFKWQANLPRVPMDEYVFNQMGAGEPDITDTEWKSGLWGYMVNLVEVYTEIQNFHQDLADTVEWNEAQIDDMVQNLEKRLTSFRQAIGPDLEFSIENLATFVGRGLGRVFVAFHLGFHHYYTLLFYHYLDRRRPQTRNSNKYSQSCKHHAKVVCDILKASREVPGAEAVYNIVGHVTIVSSSVLLHTFMFGEPHELEVSKLRLESNLQSLIQLRRYWPSVEHMINRLVVFQKTCINSRNMESYRFDKWMVKFLIAHALALEDKVDNAWSDSHQHQSSGDDQLERGLVTQAMITELQNYSMDCYGTGYPLYNLGAGIRES